MCSEALGSISALLADAVCLGTTEARRARDGCKQKHRKCKEIQVGTESGYIPEEWSSSYNVGIQKTKQFLTKNP